MELTELKRVQNTKELPGYSLGAEAGDAGNAGESNKPNFFLKIGLAFTKEGAIGKAFTEKGAFGLAGKFLEGDNKLFGTNGAAMATGAMGVVDMVGQIGAAGKFNRTADDLLQDAGKSQSNIGGVGYTVQNDVDRNQIEKETGAEATSNTIGLTTKGASTGAAIGSLAGPVGSVVGGAIGAVGGFIGGLFGGGAKKREMKKQLRLAEIKRINTNDFNRSGALTTVLQNNLAETEGDQAQQTLYAAANGKESYSAGGPTSGYNARVSNGEIIANKFTGEMFRVPGIPNNKDGKLAFIRPSDTIISNKYGLSDYVALTGDLEGGEAMQGTIMKALGKRGYKNGKLPGFDNGYLSNILGHGLPMLSELFLYRNIKNQDIEHNDTNVKNPYEQQALYTLGQLQENPYAIIPELYNEYAKGMYAISNAGGLGGGQRTLARLTAMNNLMNQSAKLQQSTQAANIGHKQTWANAMLSAGAQSAQNEAAARRYDLDRYSKAHAAKLAGEQEARKGAWSQFMAGIKGIVDNKRYNDTMDLYRQKSKIENDYYEALTRNLLGNKVTAENSKDWSWLPEVYGPLNRNIQLTPLQVVPSGLQYPWSLKNSAEIKPKIYEYNAPKLTQPSDLHSILTQTLTKQNADSVQRPVGVVTPDTRENTLTDDAQLRSSGRYNFDNNEPVENTQKSKKTLEDAKNIIKKYRGNKPRTRQTDMDFWKNQDNIKKLMQVYWDMTGVNKAY